MTGDEIPQELLSILDQAAGKTHSRTGPVVSCLAAILTRYDEMRSPHAREEPCAEKARTHL